MVTNDIYITATQVCELWSKIAALGLMGLRRFRSAKKAQTITGKRVNLDV